jgi:hypothetical protein
MKGLITMAGIFVAALAVGVTGALPAAAEPSPAARPASVAGPARETLQPWPITITIRTVPALPGVRFLFDGTPLVTGSGGSTSVTERHNFSAHTLTLAQTQLTAGQRRYAFVRWAGQRDPDQAFRSTIRGLPMRANYTVTASFGVSCRVSPRLVEQNGTAIASSQVSKITLRDSLGQPAELSPSGASWLRCAWPVYRDSLLYSRDLEYSVQAMLVGGSNVVHAGVERFTPTRTPDPTLTGFFYSLTITAHDALFGGATGSYALLTMPDHAVRRVELSSGHAATVGNLPQGNYQVAVKEGGASIPSQTVRLSRDQTANLAAISTADIAVVAGALVAGVAGIPLVSRTRRQRLLGFLARRLGFLTRRRVGEEAG